MAWPNAEKGRRKPNFDHKALLLSMSCIITDNPSSILANKPLNKDPVNKLKKNQEPFLQDASCGEIAPKLMKCRECKMRNKKLPNIFCRFYAFRR